MERKQTARKKGEEKEKTFLLKIPGDIHTRLKGRAAQEQTTMGRLIVELINNYLQKGAK